MARSREYNSLPREPIQRFTVPLTWFLKTQTLAGAFLLGATILALAFSNSPLSDVYLGFWETHVGFHIGTLDMTRPLHAWINDGLMTLLFFVVALELKRELTLGELQNRRMALLPLAGAIGGMVFPALLYWVMTHGSPHAHGWGTVMATDTAFLLGCLALFGSKIPPNLRLFLLSLVIFDDVGAILVVAFGYGAPLNWVALSLGLIGFGIVAGASRLGLRSVVVYSILGGLIWLCVDSSGIHPTLVGVLLGLMTPTTGWVSNVRLRAILGKVLSYPDSLDRRDLKQAGVAARETLSPVERLEILLHPWVGYLVMPLFALANAGVVITSGVVNNPISLAIIIALVCGKPFGVFMMSWLAVRLNWANMLPSLNWPLLAAGSILTGIGFTMSLFIANLAFAPQSLPAAKAGILLASVIAATVGLSALAWLLRKEVDRTTSPTL